MKRRLALFYRRYTDSQEVGDGSISSFQSACTGVCKIETGSGVRSGCGSMCMGDGVGSYDRKRGLAGMEGTGKVDFDT